MAIEGTKEWREARQASIKTIDFSKGPSIRQHASGNTIDSGHSTDQRPISAEGRLLTPKQIRARARRRAKRGGKSRMPAVTEQEFAALYKPIEEWDMQELAKGRPRDANGKFGGRTPGWITREVHEKAMELFTLAIKADMNALTPDALESLRYVIQNEEVDERGKPVIPASAKNQASMFLLEHLLGKPKQRIETDISVKLQSVLASVMVNPTQESPDQPVVPDYSLAHFPGQTIPIGGDDVSWSDDDDSDLDESGEG